MNVNRGMFGPRRMLPKPLASFGIRAGAQMDFDRAWQQRGGGQQVFEAPARPESLR